VLKKKKKTVFREKSRKQNVFHQTKQSSRDCELCTFQRLEIALPNSHGQRVFETSGSLALPAAHLVSPFPSKELQETIAVEPYLERKPWSKILKFASSLENVLNI
jgi:hypothetical protein